MTTTNEHPEPAPVAEALAPVLRKLEERGLPVVPASELESGPRRETAAEKDRREAIRRDHYAARWAEKLPALYADANLDDLMSEVAAETTAEARKVIAWLSHDGSPTLVLAGPVGVGKTHAAYAVANAAAERMWVEAWTVTDLLAKLQGSGDSAVAAAVRSCHLLLLDDLGTGKATDWATDTLTSILDARTREQRRQIITTNHRAEDLEAAWGSRLMDRLRFRWTVVVLTGPSRRVGGW